MNRPLRFCMITTFYPPYNFGGDGIFVHRLANELAKRGHQVDVVHCIDTYRLLAGTEPGTTYDDHHNVTVHGLKSPFGFLSPLATHQTGFPFFKSAQIKHILNKGFDVIHFHNISLVGGPGILKYGQAIKLYTTHEYWLICPTHVLFKYNRSACTKRNCLLCSIVYKRPPQLWRYSSLLKKAVRHLNAILAPSHFCKQIHLQSKLYAPIVSFPNFLPRTKNQKSLNLNVDMNHPEKPYFLFVGRLEKIKGLQTLIPVFRQYKKAQLVIVGNGSYERQLRDLSRNTTNILFLGYKPYSELEPLYRQAVALIVPSLCLEIFPSVTLEAFSQQTPAIIRNLGSMPEIIRKSGGGLVYDSESELIDAMDLLLTDTSYRQNWA